MPIVDPDHEVKVWISGSTAGIATQANKIPLGHHGANLDQSLALLKMQVFRHGIIGMFDANGIGAIARFKTCICCFIK